MADEDFPAPSEGFVVTHFIVAADVARSRDFYSGVLGGKVVLESPADPTRAGAFLNLRVADIHAVYQEWRSRGAEFFTPPKVHSREIRCYLRDPDGHLIEVGQTTRVPT